MPTASLIKFPVMIETYRQAAAKKIDLDAVIAPEKARQGAGLGGPDGPLLRGQHVQAPRRCPAHDRLLGQYGHQPGARRDRHRGDRRDHGEAGVSQHQDPFQGVSPRHVGLPRAEQAVRPGEHDARRDDRALRGGLSQAAREPRRPARRCSRICGPARTRTNCPASCRRKRRSPSRPAASIDTRTAAGIIECPGGPVAVCVLSCDNEDKRWVPDNAGNRLCAEIARAVYDHFDRAADRRREARAGRRSPPVSRSRLRPAWRGGPAAYPRGRRTPASNAPRPGAPRRARPRTRARS